MRSLAAVGLVGLLVSGCTSATLQPSSDAYQTPRDKALLAHTPYAQVPVPQTYQRHIVDSTGRERPGTIVVDTSARFLYYVMPKGKAIRYGVTVGEQGQAWSGVAQVGRLQEWPEWIPTADIQKRLGPYPSHVAGGPRHPLRAGGIYLYDGGQGTLYRIHGTHQPGNISQAHSARCLPHHQPGRD